MDYANAYLDPDDYARIRAEWPLAYTDQDQVRSCSGSMTVDPDAHGGNPGTVQRRASDGLLLGGFVPVTTGTAWFEAMSTRPGWRRSPQASPSGAPKRTRRAVRRVLRPVHRDGHRTAAAGRGGLHGRPLSVRRADRGPRRHVERRADRVALGVRRRVARRDRAERGQPHYTAPGTYTAQPDRRHANAPPSTATGRSRRPAHGRRRRLHGQSPERQAP